MVKKPPPLPGVKRFQNRLSSLLRTWRRGVFTCGLLRILTLLLIAIGIYCVIDYFLATGNTTRQITGVVLIIATAGLVIRELIRIFQFKASDLARRADARSGSRRHPALSALELLQEKNQDSTGLQSFLVKRSVEQAGTSLDSLTNKDIFPGEDFRKQGVRFLIAGAILTTAIFFLWPVASVLLSRIAQPWEDIPPYSPLRFAVTPTHPEIFYGEDATATVEITGGDITQPVRFLTRHGDDIFETVCFQDGPNRFAQKLEGVVKPTEFAFAHGRARSEWHKVDLLLEPKVALASVTVAPPAYARKPKRTFLIGEEPLAALRGSKITLSVTSNRPLHEGEISVSPSGAKEGSGKSINGRKGGAQTLTFEWTLEEEAELDVAIRDIRGTGNKDPFLISQRIVPDKAPKITLDEPPLHLMATPSIKVPLAGKAEDDLGLGRIELVRTVVGYRDRMNNISPPTLERRFEYQSNLELSTLGVAPGETLEFYLEAMDRNPNLLGVAASEVARVQIISEEEYATMIRSRTTVKEFAERFNVVNRALRELREAMEELKKARESGDSETEAKAREKAAKAAEQASKLFEMLSNDFAAFDLEKDAIANAKQTQEEIQNIGKQMKGDQALSDEDIAKMMETLGIQEQQYKEQQKKADEVAAVGNLMELASEFSALVRDQESLTRRLKKFEQETRSSDLPFLKALGEDQEALRERLNNFTKELEKRTDELPPQYQDLADSAREFLEATKSAGAGEDMKESTESAENEDGGKSYQYSALALEKLSGLLGQDPSNSFAGMCQGKMKFQPPGPLKQTLQQMLSSIGLRRGQGSGFGSGNQPGSGQGGSGGGGGMGGGGDSNDGYSMGGYTALDIPVIGPPRMRLQDTPFSQMADGDSDTPKRKEDAVSSVNESDRINLTRTDPVTGTAPDLDRVPEKYRDAVKRYFSPDKPSSSTPENNE